MSDEISTRMDDLDQMNFSYTFDNVPQLIKKPF